MPDAWMIVVGVPLVVLFWCSVVVMISFIGGWHSLAKVYRAEETTFRIARRDEGKRFRWASLAMGPNYFPKYGNCVNVVVSERGIGLRVWLIFRVFHPPLLIPWSAVESCDLDKQILIFTRATVYLRDRSNPIRFYGKCAWQIESDWANRNAAGDAQVPLGYARTSDA